jgi:hypothetical protein
VDDDEAVEISFNQTRSGLKVTVAGFDVDHRIFGSPTSELFDSASADNSGSYRTGNSGGMTTGLT